MCHEGPDVFLPEGVLRQLCPTTYARQYKGFQTWTVDNNTLTVVECPWAMEEDVQVNSEHDRRAIQLYMRSIDWTGVCVPERYDGSSEARDLSHQRRKQHPANSIDMQV